MNSQVLNYPRLLLLTMQHILDSASNNTNLLRCYQQPDMITTVHADLVLAVTRICANDEAYIDYSLALATSSSA